MSTEEVRRVSREDIQLVQKHIEQCLPLHISQQAVMNTLLVKAKIEPKFTELVWQKLEVENPDFFKGYHLQLLLKDQIVRFNILLETQLEFMRDLSIKPPSTIHMSNGSDIPQTGQIFVSSFSSAGSHLQPISFNSLLEAHAAYDNHTQTPRSFNLPDLTTNSSLVSDILESYSGSPYIAADSAKFLIPQLRVEQEDNGSMETISEEMNSNDFGSN